MAYLTKEKLEELKNRLQYLKTTKREEIAKRISEAQEHGDISENAEFDMAKEERAFNERDILKLEDLIRNAIIIEESKTVKDVVGVGSTVKIEIFGEKIDYTIVGSEEVDLENNKISNESPIGRALIGKKKGDKVEVNLPSGKVKIKIIKIL